MARAVAFALLLLMTACASRPVRLSYQPQQGSYPEPGPPDDPWRPYIEEASRRFDVPAQWIRAVMHQESGGHEYLDGSPITSSAGAMGLMQLMPATYGDLQSQYGLGGDPYDPHDNIMAGTGYIRQMYDKYGSPGFLAAYNAGPARVDDYLAGQGSLPAETENYVASIAPHLGDQAVTAAPVEVADSAPVSEAPPPPEQQAVQQPERQAVQLASSDGRCWHDPNVAYDPTEPCISAPVVETLPAETEPAPAPAVYAPAPSAIGGSQPLPPPSGMAFAPPPPAPAPILRQAVREASYEPARMPVSSPGPWAIQVGAFGRPDEARTATQMAAHAAPGMLGGSREVVTTVGGLGGHPLYRARLAGLDRQAALAACGTLRGEGMPCLLVAPGG
jgi:hypothetical protein